jgi:hypothetical protein
VKDAESKKAKDVDTRRNPYRLNSLYQPASWNYALSVQGFSCYTPAILDGRKVLELKEKDNEWSKTWEPYGNEINSAFSVGDEISIPSVERRGAEKMSRINHANMWCGRCEDIEGSGEQGSCAYAHRVSTVTKCEWIDEKDKGKNIKATAARVSRVAQEILGKALLGNRIRGMEYGKYHRRISARVFRASPKSVEWGTG